MGDYALVRKNAGPGYVKRKFEPTMPWAVNEERLAQLMAQVPHGRPPQGGVINRKARDASKIRAADEVDLSKAQRV